MRKILVIGAHPDDCEVCAGGTAFLWRQRGDRVSFVSMTNGDAGHFSEEPESLARRRREESAAVARALDIEYLILDHHDGRLEPTLACREEIIRLIRREDPDLILTHRPNDYHPDHRYTSVIVQDAAYTVTVPLICSDTPHLRKNPVFGYLSDAFQKPAPFSPDVAIDVDAVMPEKWKLLHAHESQFYEWLPYNDGTADEVPPPDRPEDRLAWLERRWSPEFSALADRSRASLAESYGAESAARVRFAEAFEISEYGSQPSTSDLRALFPLAERI